VDTDRHKTGVTVILPCEDDIFQNKMVAACHVLNGFGKTAGLMQIQELGTLESPIALTNTLNVGLVHDALVEYLCQKAEQNGYAIRSVNPVVCECNDASLNDIRHRAVGQDEVFHAIKNACVHFRQGDVGAGKGMTCHDLKGGIGTASRQIEIDGEVFHLGDFKGFVDLDGMAFAALLEFGGKYSDFTQLFGPVYQLYQAFAVDAVVICDRNSHSQLSCVSL
jgi:D-aminopeptidase